jgi:hypothetical protein
LPAHRRRKPASSRVTRGTGEPRPDAGLQLAAVIKELGEPDLSFVVLIERNGKPMQLRFVTRELY